MSRGGTDKDWSQLETRSEAARYIARLTRELSMIAQKHELGFLCYLLGMAHDEAVTQAECIRLETEQE